MGIQAPAEVKYQLISNAIRQDNNLLCISTLCEMAGVSRSGYYNWVGRESARQERQRKDDEDFALVLEAYQFRGYSKGARSIHMRLLHVGIRMNVKKIRRLMKQNNLFCPIRRENPYRKMARDMRTNNVAKNIVNRHFLDYGMRKVLLTDITYLYYRNGVCYLSTILDACTREILAYELSDNLRVDFVIATVETLIRQHGCTLDNTTIIHSDQGCHYTSRAFIEKLRDADFVQSMSRKGVCWDNAPQESFFGHMKDDIRDEISKCQAYGEVQRVVDDWIDYYNNDRYQWELLKLSPKEYYRYLSTGIYPLEPYRTPRGSAPDPEV